MTITFLHELFVDAFSKLANLLVAQDSCKPTLEQLENLAVDIQMENDRPAGVPQNPLFFCNLVLKPDRFEVDPSKYDLNIRTKIFA